MFKRMFTALVALVAVSAPAIAAPETIYFFTGVYQSDPINDSGVASVFTCTNVSPNTARLVLTVRGETGTVLSSSQASLTSMATYTFSTKSTASHSELIMGVGGSFTNASMEIKSDQLGVRCLGKVVTDASASAPNGYVLTPVRFRQTRLAEE